MKAYKGFYREKDGRIYCQPNEISNKFYYEEGKTYECEDAILCNYGFHACTLPIDVFNYYNSKYCSVEFHEVELDGVSDERLNDSKVVGTKITIGKEVTIDEMLDISIKMILVNKEKYFKNKPFYIIRKDTKWNFLKPDGTLLSEQWFDFAYSFENEIAGVKLKDKYNFIREDGTLLSEQWFEWVDYFQNGLALVKLDNEKWIYLKPDGTYLTEQWFEYVGYFSNDFARVRIGNKYNFIKRDGTLLWNKPVEQWFDDAFNFNNGLAKVKLDNHWYKLNDKGELIK